MAARLARSLNFVELVFYGVGTIVGAGIYTILGAAGGMAGEAVWISLLCASLAAFITALSYAELVSMYPRAGAEYQFVRRAFPGRPLWPFLAGYLIALNAAATSATVALAFAGYLNVFVALPPPVTALALLALCTALNIWGLRQATWASIALICVEVGGLLLLIGAAGFDAAPARAPTLPSAGEIGPVFAATSLVFFIYIGFEDVANLAEEARQPRRDLPRALLISVVLTSVIYLLVTFAVLSVVSPEQLARSEAPLTTAANAIAPWLGNLLAVSALFATASTALISLVSISRLLFGMARQGDMPRALARTGDRRRTPWVAALALFAGACLLLPLGEVKLIASVSAFGVLLVFTAVQAALIALRLRKPHAARPFRVPGAVCGAPVLPALGIAICLALISQFEPIVYAVGLAALLAGALIYALMPRRRARAPSGS